MVKKIIIPVLFLLMVFHLQAQQKIVISKSQVINTRDGKQYYIHTVKPGQTVYSLAKAYDVSMDEIFYENPGSKNGISVGQQLWIPVVSRENELKKELKSANFEFFYHIVKKNETLARIASEYHLQKGFLLRANPEIKEPLREGQYIKIPVEMAYDRRHEKDQGGSHHGNPDETVNFNPDIPVVPDLRHVVKSGETTAEIAAQYKVDVNLLKAVNIGLGDYPDAGERLRIPQQKKKEQKLEYVHYKVKKKETLYSISRQYGLTAQDLLKANPGLTTSLKVGQVIRIPKKVVTDKYLTHNITSKTKIKKLAKLYGIPVYDITDANPGIGNKLYPGETVKIPVGEKTLRAEEEEKKGVPVVEEKKEIIPVIFGKGCNKNLKPDKKRVFKVALMVPLYLEQLDSLDTKQFLQGEHDNFKPFRFIKFYEGALIAADSLQKQGMNVRLYVYDVDQSIIKTTKVLQRSELRQMDLIIGPFFSRSFDQVALFAGNFGIPIVNPLSFREEVVQKYETVIKVKPGEEYQLDLLKNLLQSDYSDARIFLISQTAYKAADKVVELQNMIQEAIPAEVRIKNEKLYDIGVEVAQRHEEYRKNQPVPVFKIEGHEMYPDILAADPDGTTIFKNNFFKINYSLDSLHPFYRNASAARRNLIILYGDNRAFVMDVMNRLGKIRDTFNIQMIGLPTWERFENLNLILCSQMNLTYFSSSYVDYEREEISDLIYKFRNCYNTDPEQMGLIGFDVTYYFLEALFHLGKKFEACLPEFPMDMTENKYIFDKKNWGENFENKHWNILRYQKLKLVKINSEF